MLQTPRRKILYPNPDRSDRPDVPLHLGYLAVALDVDVLFAAGLDSDRQSAAHQVGGGKLWWSTDTLTMWYDDGTAWRQLGNAPLNSPAFTGIPQAPTPPAGDKSTRIATTAFVASFFPTGAILPYAGGAAPTGWLMCDGNAISRTTYSDLFAILGTTYGPGDGSTTFNVPDLRGRVPVGKNSGTFATLGDSGGEETHTTIVAEMPSHTHTAVAVSAGTPAGTVQNNTAGLATNNNTVDHTHNYQRPVLSAVVSFTPGADFACTSTALTPTSGESSVHSHTIPAHSHVFVGTALAPHTHTINNAGGGTPHNNLQPYLVLNYLIKI